MTAIPARNRTDGSSEHRIVRQGGRSSEADLKQLMVGGIKGDANSYSQLLRAVTRILTSFYGRRLRDREADVEDLVQETLIAVHNRRCSYDQSRPFTPWLFAIARHKLVDSLRRRRVHEPIDGLDDILRTEGFEEAANAQVDIDRLLKKLPVKQAQAIRQTRLKGLSVAETAKMLGIGESDVKVSVHRGLKTLAGQLANAA